MERTPLLNTASADTNSVKPHAEAGPGSGVGATEGARRAMARRSSGDGDRGCLSSLGSASTRQYLAGVALLLGVVTLWSLSDFISAALQTGDHAWNKPFL
jgi:hypothetical protein